MDPATPTKSPETPSRGVCTIVSKNYLAFARTLARSIQEQQPDLRMFVVLADRVDGAFDPAAEPFELIEAKSLAIDGFRELTFKYDVLELNTAIKPFALEYLLDRFELDELFYLDPDTFATAPLTPIFDHFERHSILLNPHITRPYQDDARPRESDHLRSGTYNLGFAGVANRPQAREMLRWWQERCRNACVVRLEDGLFVDQKWMDLAPSLFSETGIVRHPGFNVAYWNLHERVLDGQDPPTCNGEPLLLFHFSGIDLGNLDRVSKHQDRFRLTERPDLRPLFESYAERLLANGAFECAKLEYAYASFDDGTPIDSLMRRLYHSLSPEDRARFGDPFDAGGPGTFFHWMRQPAVPRRAELVRGRNRHWQRIKARARAELYRWHPHDNVDHLLYFLHRSDVSVKNRFPDVFGRDRVAFLRWISERRPRLWDEGSQERFRHDVTTSQQLHPLQQILDTSLLGCRESGYPSALARERERHDAALGINSFGYFTTESGIGEAARSVSEAIEAANLPLARRNIDAGPTLRARDTRYSEFSSDNPHPVNLFHVNADQLRQTRRQLGKATFRGRYNVGYWLWELPAFPKHWEGRFRYLDEVWTPSTYCLEAIATRSTRPVIRIPIPVDGRVETTLEREHFGLPNDVCLFLFTFDFMSFFERKNPLAVIRAFREAFQANEDAMLLIKSSNGAHFPEQLGQMKLEAEGARIRFIDDYLERNELRNLLRICDAYISLHRCEGFGLAIAESMSMGKPVIATGFSANLDFMSWDNGLLVRHEFTEIERDIGPYERGQLWAEPDVAHAAECIQRIYGDADLAKQLGERARHDIGRTLSYAAVGAQIRRRLEALG